MSVVRKVITTALAPVGPYSPGVLAGNTLYVSGQLGLDTSGNFVSTEVGEQARQALKNIGHILEAGSSSFDKIVKTTVLLRRMSDYQVVNDVYKEFFKNHDSLPARACYAVAGLPKDGLVEIEAIAIAGDVEQCKL